MAAPYTSFPYSSPRAPRSWAWLTKALGGSGRKRIAVILAAITVPAMAAPDMAGRGLTTLPGNAVESTATLATRQAAAAALPFERPGMSFPGSAYYYMADPAGTALVALPSDNPLGQGAESGRALGALIDVGAAAKPFYAPGVGIAHLRAAECLAQAVWYEAASESEAGQRAVAQVVLNRVAHPSWPSSVCGVVYQGSERSTGCQFTFTCDGSLARRPGGASWAQAQRIASDALNGSVYAPVGLATHYHTLWVNPYWAPTLDHIGTIGAHRFYRTRGASGQAGAFTNAYAGLEPSVSGRTTPLPFAAPIANDAAPSRPTIAYELDPAPVTKQVRGGGAKTADPLANEVPTPAFAEAGAVKAEFARSGQWKARPGGAPTPAAKD